MTDAEFLAALESGTLPEADFDHAGHVRAAWLYLRQSPFSRPETLASPAARRVFILGEFRDPPYGA